jgi:autotransporter-associated beta strand protein
MKSRLSRLMFSGLAAASTQIPFAVNAQDLFLSFGDLVAYYDFEQSGILGLVNKAPGATSHNGAYLGDVSLIAGAGAGFGGNSAYPGAVATQTTDRSQLLVGNALNVAKANTSTTAGKGQFQVMSLTSRGTGLDGGGSLGTEFTVSSWFHAARDANNTSTTGDIIRSSVFEAVLDGATNTNVFDISWGTSGNNSTYSPYLNTTIGSSSVLPDNNWHHVLHTVTSDGTTSTLRSYVNGTLSATITAPTNTVDFRGINFGAHRTGGRIFDGLMDEVNVWGRSLDASEAFSVYNLGFGSQALTSNITSHTKADNTSNLNLGGAWESGNAPGAADYLIFNSDFTQSGALSTDASMTIAGLRVTSGTGLIDINNSDTFTTGSLGIDMATATRDLRVASLATGANQNWNIAAGRTLTLDGLSGTADVTRMGAGSLMLNGANTLQGTLNITGGLTTLGAPSAISASGSISVGTGAALTLRLGSGLFGAGDFDNLWNNTLTGVTMAAGARAGIDTTETVTLTTDLSGARGLALSGSGTLVLTGDNTYTGGTTVAGGTLQLGTGDTTGTITGNIANSGTVAFNRSDDIIYANVISGSGGLIKDGAGRLTLTAVQSFTGDTVINSGILQINGGSPGSGLHRINSATVRINAGGTLHFNDTAQFGWAAGTPAVVLDGGSITTANNTYQYIKDITMSNGASIQFGAVGSGLNAVQNYSTSSLVSQASSETNGMTGGAMALLSGAAAMTVDVERGTAATDLRIETVLRNHPGNNNPGNLVKTGHGILELAATNTYTGTTTVSAGTLLVTGALGATAVTVESGATIGGSGSIGGALNLNAGANLDLSGAALGLESPGILSVSASHAILLTDFQFDNLLGWDWFDAVVGTYTLINGGSGVTLAGNTPTSVNPYDFGNGRSGYFQAGSLQVVIIPEPGTAFLALFGTLMLLRRRRL